MEAVTKRKVEQRKKKGRGMEVRKKLKQDDKRKDDFKKVRGEETKRKRQIDTE